MTYLKCSTPAKHCIGGYYSAQRRRRRKSECAAAVRQTVRAGQASHDHHRP
jgi:hypothetical protein